MEQTTETQDRSYAQQLVDEYYGNYEKVKPSEAELPNILSIIEFMLDKFYYPNGINLEPIKDDFESENLSDTIGGRVEAEVMPNEVVAGDIKLMFGEDTEKYSLWGEIVNDVYMEYDDTSDASKAEDLMHKIEKLLKLVSQREA